MCRESAIKQYFTSPYNPERNGICERINLTIITLLIIYKSQYIYDVFEIISRRINQTYHRTIKTSPLSLIFQYYPNDPYKLTIDNIKPALKRIQYQLKIMNEIMNKRRKILFSI
ncbi:Pro-Pol polyprotein [Dictyocoela muelleri]|nr:Pro-Pol polyprotein [Dictyocoela muelleri]